MEFIDSSRFISSALSNLTENLIECQNRCKNCKYTGVKSVLKM